MRVQYWKPFRIFLGKSSVLCRRHQWLHEFRTAEHTPVYDSVLAAGMRRRYVARLSPCPGWIWAGVGGAWGLSLQISLFVACYNDMMFTDTGKAISK
jgi:hypothetical protein